MQPQYSLYHPSQEEREPAIKTIYVGFDHLFVFPGREDNELMDTPWDKVGCISLNIYLHLLTHEPLGESDLSPKYSLHKYNDNTALARLFFFFFFCFEFIGLQLIN